MIQVSIIIVNYNTKILLLNCLHSILEQTKSIDYEIIVSDNGSTDGSIEMLRSNFPNVILIENNENIGFGCANNRGLAIARGEYIFYLNSDTILLNNAVKIFYDFFELHKNENIGALGANLLDENQNIIHSFGKFPSFKGLTGIVLRDILSQSAKFILHILNKDREHFRISKKNDTYYVGEVGYITGADLFVKNDDFAKFDEKFILYYEETDLQKKLEKNLLKRILIEGPQIIHLEGGSNSSCGKKFISFGNLTAYISMVYYCKKNISKLGAAVLRILIAILWLNPMHFHETRKYISRLFKI